MLDNAIAKLGRARDKKDAGLRLIKAEYKFLMGQEPVHPHVDGHYVMARLIKELIESMDKDEAEDFLQKFMPSEEIEKAIVEETETEEATNGKTDIQETP